MSHLGVNAILVGRKGEEPYLFTSCCKGFAAGERSHRSSRENVVDIGKHQRISRLMKCFERSGEGFGRHIE